MLILLSTFTLVSKMINRQW